MGPGLRGAFAEGYNTRSETRCSIGRLIGWAGFVRIAEGEPAGCPRRWRIFDATRGETANVFVIDDRLYMVDCGYGALGALVRASLNYRFSQLNATSFSA